ncbi:MAG: ParB N-terminal domain-containing protein [Deltaproteobacteria bacterium]|nr:MAG: ParB N-terminal domain-containing protein [Deltaproteobacteria bacterium]
MLKRRNPEKVETERIDFEDRIFSATYPLECERIKESIARIGLIQPLIVRQLEKTGKYQVVCGLRRALACRELGFEKIEAMVYPEAELSDQGGFLLGLFENLGHRDYNDIERSMVLSKLHNQFGLDQSLIIGEYLPLLGLEAGEAIFHQYLPVIELEEEIKEYVVQRDLPVRVPSRLLTLSPEDRQASFRLISRLNLGVNRIMEFLNFLEETSQRDGVPIKGLLGDREIEAVLDDEGIARPRKVELIRYILRKKRYPQLTGIEAQVEEGLKQMHLPPELKISPPPYFEGDELKVEFQFRDPKKLKKVAERLLELSKSPEIKEILKII